MYLSPSWVESNANGVLLIGFEVPVFSEKPDVPEPALTKLNDPVPPTDDLLTVSDACFVFVNAQTTWSPLFTATLLLVPGVTIGSVPSWMRLFTVPPPAPLSL